MLELGIKKGKQMSNYPAQPNYQNIPNYQQGNISYQQPYGAPQANPADSVGSWMLALLLTGIPIVGFIYLLVVAFGGSASISKQNWARAAFIWQLIAIGIMLLFILFAALGMFGTAQSLR